MLNFFGGGGGDGDAKPVAKGAGPVDPEHRRCTDVLCLAFFVAFWCGMLAIMSVSLARGDINAIRYGADYRGNRCGVGDFADRPKTIYPRLDEDLVEQSAFIDANKPWLLQLFGLCVPECIDPENVTVRGTGAGADVNFVYRLNYNWNNTPEDYQRRYAFLLPEVSLLNRCFPYQNAEVDDATYCYAPTCTQVDRPCALEDRGDKRSWEIKANMSQSVKDQCEVRKQVTDTARFSLFQESAIRRYVTGQLGSLVAFVESLQEAQVQIGVTSLVFPFVLGYLWILLLRVVARWVIYFMLLLMGTVLLLATAMSFTYACMIPNDELYNCTAQGTQEYSYGGFTVENTDMYRIAFFVALALLIVFCVSVSVLQKAIQTCIAIVEESAVVVGHLPALMAVPLGGTAASVLVFVYFSYIGLYIVTSKPGTYEDFQDRLNSLGTEGIIEADEQNTTYFVFCYHLFGTLWSLAFLIGLSIMTIAGGVSHWFFFRDDPARRVRFPTVKSFLVAARFHLGTVAFGSALVAVAQFLRIVLEYIDQRTKNLQESNLFMKLLLKCVKCCMWCLENVLKFITGYSYVYTAIEGLPFCAAARETFYLILKYPAQVYVNHLVQLVLKLVQSVTVPFVCAISCYYWASQEGLNNAMYAALVTLVISYFITRIFAAVYEVVIESIFVCSFRDRDKYGAAHTPNRIRKAFGLEALSSQDREANNGYGGYNSYGAYGTSTRAPAPPPPKANY